MARKKLTDLQREYQKQRQRLLQAIRRDEKRGYYYPEDIVPKMPKRITKRTLEKITNMKPKDIRAKSQIVNVETGELTSYKKYKKQLEKQKKEVEKLRKQAQKTAKKKAKETPHYPTMTAVQKVKEQIEQLSIRYGQYTEELDSEIKNLKRKRPPYFDIEGNKQILLSIYEQTISEAESNNMLQELEDYLLANEYDIEQNITNIEYWSGIAAYDKVEKSFAHLGVLLNHGKALTAEQSTAINEMNETNDNWSQTDITWSDIQ